jgi:hypothetical protein
MADLEQAAPGDRSLVASESRSPAQGSRVRSRQKAKQTCGLEDDKSGVFKGDECVGGELVLKEGHYLYLYSQIRLQAPSAENRAEE